MWSDCGYVMFFFGSQCCFALCFCKTLMGVSTYSLKITMWRKYVHYGLGFILVSISIKIGFDFNFRFGSSFSFFSSKIYYLSITFNLQSAFDIFNMSIYPPLFCPNRPFVLLFFFILINPLLSCHLDPPFHHSLLHLDPLPIHLLLVTVCRSL
jgi:hypothetical protein